MSLDADDNTKWLGWRVGTAIERQTEELAEVKDAIKNLQKVMVEISIKLSEIIDKE